jgi:hypothetical protein
MAANPVYYGKEYARKVLSECPTITEEKFIEGFDLTNTQINAIVGIANEVARLAISDGIDAIKKAGLFRQRTKQLCNETVRRQEEYERAHNSNFGERLSLWLDYLDGTEEVFRRHIFIVYNAVKMVLDKHHQSNAELKARLECGLICAQLAVAQFDALMRDMKQKFNVDYAPVFAKGRYTNPLYVWRQVCDIYVKTDDPNETIDLNHDANLRTAVDVLSRKLSDGAMLNKICDKAIVQNMEIARKYVSEEDLNNLGIG